MTRLALKLAIAASAATAAAAAGTICGVVRANNLVSLASFDNATGKVQAAVPLVGLAQQFWSAGAMTAGAVDSGTTMYYVVNASSTLLGTANLPAQMSSAVVVRPPAGYAGDFTIAALNIDVNASAAPVALLVGTGGGGWVVLADVDPTTGASTARTNLTGAYFGTGLAYKPGLSALDPYSSTLWLAAPGSDGDVALGFNVSGPLAGVDAPPTVVPFPEGSTLTSLRFAGPFFSGPGLLATVSTPSSSSSRTETATSTVSLLGSFVNQAGGADFFEVANYEPALSAGGPGQLALNSPAETVAHVGLQQGASSVVSVVDTQSNEELGRVRPQGFTVLTLVACIGGPGQGSAATTAIAR